MAKRIKLLIGVGLMLSISVIFNSCMQFRVSDKKLKRQFHRQGLAFEIKYTQIGIYRLRSVVVGDSSLPVVICIHGSPGSLRDFLVYTQDTTLLREVCFLLIDRPGYGYSSFHLPPPPIDEQARLLLPLVQAVGRRQKLILVGYSYGGPVAARLAMLAPDDVDALILAAPALDPNNEKYFWFNRPLEYVRWLLPTALKHAQIEKMRHVADLSAIQDDWQRIQCPVTLIHGQADKIVPNHAQFVKEHLGHVPLRLITPAHLGHLFVFFRPEYLKEAILHYLRSPKPPAESE